MSVIRVEKNKNYTIMSNYHLRDENLTLREKGLLSIVFSLPNDWDFSIRGLAKYIKKDKDTVQRVIYNLRQKNYVKLIKKRNEKGHIFYEYIFYENPQVINNPCPHKPVVENGDTTNNYNKLNTNDSNKVLSFINNNTIEQKKEMQPNQIKDKITLFNYFVNFDIVNFDKYTKLYFRLKNETNHNIFIIFSYVFTKINELDKSKIRDLYSYVEKSVYSNIEKLDILDTIEANGLWDDL